MRKPGSLKHQPRPVLYDSGVVSRMLDDAFGAGRNDFVATYRLVASARRVFINQTVLFGMQPVLRVLQNRYPSRADSIEQALTDFNLLELDERIGETAISLKRGIEQLKFADATIAATALVYG